MEEEIEIFDDEYTINELREELNTYKEFLDYIVYKAVGDKSEIIETFNGNETNKFCGYIKVEKEIKKDKLLLHFTYNDKEETAEWQSSDNYGVAQYTWGEDCYSGYLLFPTYKDDEYFLLSYSC